MTEKEESEILDYPEAKKNSSATQTRIDRFLQSCMLISFAVFFIAWLFKIQHWAYGDILLIFSLSSLSLIGILRYALRKSKSLLDYCAMLVYSVLPVAFLFRILHWQGDRIMLIIAGIIFFLYLTIRVTQSFRR